jgi:hypothetical protein
MDIQVLRSRYNHTPLGQHILQHSLVGHTVAPHSLVARVQKVSGQWRVVHLQLAADLRVIGYGARHTTTIIWCETTQMVSTPLLICYKADVAVTQANLSTFGPQLHK